MNQDCSASAPNRPKPNAGSEAKVDAGVWVPALKEAAWAFLVAALLLIVTYTIFFKSFHPEFIPFIDRDARKLVVPGKDLIPVSVGAASKAENKITIKDFNGDEAVLLLPRAFQAEDYPFIKVNLTGFTRYSKFKIIWRRADDMAQTYALEFNRSGDEVTQIAMVYGGENYRGQIADIALLFYDGPALGFENNDEVDIVIRSIEFLPFSATSIAEQIFEDWTNPPLWQGHSNNYVLGVHDNGVVFPNLIVNVLVITSLTIAWILRRRQFFETQALRGSFLTVAMCLCLYGWAFNDILRWHWRIHQLLDTHYRTAGTDYQHSTLNSRVLCSRFPKNCAANLFPNFETKCSQVARGDHPLSAQELCSGGG